MSFKTFLKKFISTSEGRIVASNAVDGIEIGLHSHEDTEKLLRKAYEKACKNNSLFLLDSTKLLEPTESEEDRLEYCRSLEDAVQAREWFGSPMCGVECCLNEEFLGVVWKAESPWVNLVSIEDWDRLLPLRPGLPSRTDQDWLQKLQKLDEKHRWVQFSAEEEPSSREPFGKERTFGRNFFWFTPFSEIECFIGRSEAATQIRNHLGLVHHNQGVTLMLYRIPVRVLDKVTHVRPTFVEGAMHSHFCTTPHSVDKKSSDPFGRTLDLTVLQGKKTLQAGAKERVCKPLDKDCFGDNLILFEVLGTIGTVYEETDPNIEEYSRMLAKGRSDDDLYRQLVG